MSVEHDVADVLKKHGAQRVLVTLAAAAEAAQEHVAGLDHGWAAGDAETFRRCAVHVRVAAEKLRDLQGGIFLADAAEVLADAGAWPKSCWRSIVRRLGHKLMRL
jgi:hypothetical protein